MQALITNKKSQSVSMVTGNLRRISIGFITASKKASITATINAVKILVNEIPGNRYANINALTVVISIL